MRSANLALLCVVAAWAVGCSSNSIVGNNITMQRQWAGNVGVTGHLNQIRILDGSDLFRLSVIGDANRVYVEDRVTLGKVEVWGENNIIEVPARLRVRSSLVGRGSVIVRRGPGGERTIEGGTPAETPTTFPDETGAELQPMEEMGAEPPPPSAAPSGSGAIRTFNANGVPDGSRGASNQPGPYDRAALEQRQAGITPPPNQP